MIHIDLISDSDAIFLLIETWNYFIVGRQYRRILSFSISTQNTR